MSSRMVVRVCSTPYSLDADEEILNELFPYKSLFDFLFVAIFQ